MLNRIYKLSSGDAGKAPHTSNTKKLFSRVKSKYIVTERHSGAVISGTDSHRMLFNKLGDRHDSNTGIPPLGIALVNFFFV
jgi:hypothetical protein